MNDVDHIILDKDTVRKLVEAGGAAPSGGNMQPWKVLVDGNRFSLVIDQKRSGNFLDVGFCASIFSLGSFVENVCIKASDLHLACDVVFFPKRTIQGIVAQLTFTKSALQKDLLADYIHERMTNRKLHEGEPIHETEIETLKKIVREKNKDFILNTISSFHKRQIAARILGRADGIRMTHPKLRHEMFDEIRWNNQEAKVTRDGIDIKTMELPANASKMMVLLKENSFLADMLPRRNLEEMAKPLLLGCSHIGCISTSSKFSYEMLFEAGKVVERLWLETTKKNIAFHPWTVLPFFIIRVKQFSGKGFTSEEKRTVESLDGDLKQLFQIPSEIPLFIFRLSQAPLPSERALRLPWDSYTSFVH